MGRTRSIERGQGDGMTESATRKVVVIGAGIMGRGIALASARAGYTTAGTEPGPAMIQTAKAENEKVLARAREKGDLDEANHRAAGERLTYSSEYDVAQGAQLAIEAVPESVSIKASVYEKLAPEISP